MDVRVLVSRDISLFEPWTDGQSVRGSFSGVILGAQQLDPPEWNSLKTVLIRFGRVLIVRTQNQKTYIVNPELATDRRRVVPWRAAVHFV